MKFSGMDADPHSEWRFLHGMDLPKKNWRVRVLAFTHLQPNQFMQVYLRFQPTIASHCKFCACSKDSLVSPMDVRDIAAVAVAVLPGAVHAGKRYVITGPEALIYSEVAERLSAALGRNVYVDVPLEQVRKAMVDSGTPDWFVEGQMEQYQVRLKGWQSLVIHTVMEVAKKEPDYLCAVREGSPYFRGECEQDKATA